SETRPGGSAEPLDPQPRASAGRRARPTGSVEVVHGAAEMRPRAAARRWAHEVAHDREAEEDARDAGTVVADLRDVEGAAGLRARHGIVVHRHADARRAEPITDSVAADAELLALRRIDASADRVTVPARGEGDRTVGLGVHGDDAAVVQEPLVDTRIDHR